MEREEFLPFHLASGTIPDYIRGVPEPNPEAKMANVSTQQLSYDEKAKRFVGEVSSCPIERIPTAVSREHGVRPFGVTLESHKTGIVVTFLIREEVRDAEGELQVTILTPAHGSLQQNPNLRGVTLHLLND